MKAKEIVGLQIHDLGWDLGVFCIVNMCACVGEGLGVGVCL